MKKETRMCIAEDRHGNPCEKNSHENSSTFLCFDHAFEVYLEVHREIGLNIRTLFQMMDKQAKKEAAGATAFEKELALAYAAQSVVYYVRIGDYIKIGYTENLTERLKALRVDKADVMATEPGGREKEKERHQQFAHIRRGRRENFEKTPELLTHIAKVRRDNGAPAITGTVKVPTPKEERKFSSIYVQRRVA